MVKRIKHNDLLPWFLRDHGQLPASYLKSTQKFFDELKASSDKRQATSLTNQLGNYKKDTWI
jgi:lipase chaperone LimK